MIHLVEDWSIAWLWTMIDWSIRWGLLIGALAVWLGVRPPRRAATRHLLGLSVLAGGLLLPMVPQSSVAIVPAPSRVVRAIVPSPREAPAFARQPDLEPVLIEPADAPPIPAPIVPPARRPPDLRRIAVLAAAAGWLAVVLAMLIRLAVGWLALARLRRGAVAAGPVSERLLGECRATLGLSRPVGIARHPAIATPAAVGGWRPIVLVPADWDELDESQRRACLLHELAHLARRDDWARLAQELIRAPFFFHPMVRWLLARLDRERELLCDEAAVAMGSDPVAYARLLLAMARRPGRLIRLDTGYRPGWLPFLDRRTVPVRIARLLEDDMPSTLSRPSAGRSIAVVGLALAATILVGGLRVRAGSSEPTGPPAPPEAKAPDEIRGVVLDPDGKAVAGATIVAGSFVPGRVGHDVLTTDAEGRWAWRPPAGEPQLYIVAHKEGFGIACYLGPMSGRPDPHDLGQRRLPKVRPFAAVLVDAAGKPLDGATVRVEIIAHSFEQDGQSGMSFIHVRREVIGGSPLERLFVATADVAGAFRFGAISANEGLKLSVTAADGRTFRIRRETGGTGRVRRMMEDQGFATVSPGEATRLVVVPAARVSGRVVSKVPGVGVFGLTAMYQASRGPDRSSRTTNFGDQVRTDAEGRFAFDGLDEGTINVFVHGDGENQEWTYRAAQDVALKPGASAEVTIELIRGVDVEGTVVARGTRKPVEGASVGVYGPYRPRSGAMTTSATTDASGRYHYRLPSGETYFYVMGPPKGFTRLDPRTVTIPDGVARYEVPPIEVAPAVTVHGQVVDATGAPIAGVRIVGICEGGFCRPFPGTARLTNARGEFHLPPGLYNTVAVGQVARLLVRLPDGVENELAAVPSKGGGVTLRLPVAGALAKGVEGPRDVAPDELAGVVVDTNGKPIGGAEVDAWTWRPGYEARTNARGQFRIGKLGKNSKVEVVVRKDGYTPQLFLTQPTGQPGWVIVLGNKTYFEGRVTGPDGKPIAGARIRANIGPKRADGGIITEIWTEATTEQDGRYRMYAQADAYDVQVRVPGVGVARLPGTSISPDEARRLDIALKPGVNFRANVVDSLTNDPVPGVRLWHWQHPGLEGRSGEDGVVTIPDMMPGPFRFQVDAPGFVRWWSDESSAERYRRQTLASGWQRNFDPIGFDLQPGMKPVTLTVERCATITGRVLDPDGHPVAGATVAPALTGTGNSLTGDTRFSVETDREGRFEALLPASGGREYNLVAHDGKYGQCRTWANGVMPPIRTKPGEAIRDVEIRLTRPATVRGRVVDADGKPVAGRDVRARAGDLRENRYYEPITKTAADGTYELKFIRPGKQIIQASRILFNPRQAPKGLLETLTLEPGETKGGVDFRLTRQDRDR